MPIDWLVAGPAAATAVATGVAALLLHRHLKQRKAHRLADLKVELARLEAATSELLSRVNDLDLASKYQKTAPSISARLGDCCIEVGKLAEALKEIETLTQAGNVQEANRLLLKCLTQAVNLSKEINILRAYLQ